MFSAGYAWNELRRRLGRTLVTAFGLAAGVGLVMGIIGVSEGLSDAQNRILSPLGTVGTDIIVTRTIAPTTTQSSSSNTNQGLGRGGGFFANGVGGANIGASQTQAQSLAANNSSVLTDLAKLGPAGTKFSHDFFLPGTLITFPSVATTDIAKIHDVTSSVGALSLEAQHETGTVPQITDTFKTGGQTLKTNFTAPTLTPAQEATERACIQGVLQKQFGGVFAAPVAGGGGKGTFGGRPGGNAGNSGAPSAGQRRAFSGFSSNPAFEKCLTPAQQSYEKNVVVPEQTINRVLSPPSTNTETSSYTVAGVDPTNSTTGLITKSQVVSGSWFTPTKNSDEVLVSNAYASTKNLKAGGTVTINGKGYHIEGLVSPTLTGDVSDIYFPLSTMQSLSSAPSYVNEVLVSVKSSSDVAAVSKAIQKELPGATVLTSKDLADQVSGSLSNAHKLANTLGGALAIVVLIAAFLIAALLTLSNVAKRVREIGSLRAIGWSRGEVVRQLMAEMIGIGLLGGVLGVVLGVAICAVIGAVGPGLSVTSTGLVVGASSLDQSVLHSATQASVTTLVHLTAPIRGTTVLLAIVFAVVGGVFAGAIGGWRAARLAPATALRDLG